MLDAVTVTLIVEPISATVPGSGSCFVTISVFSPSCTSSASVLFNLNPASWAAFFAFSYGV